VKRKTQSKRLTAKLKSLRKQARVRMHAPVVEQYRWLCQVLRGHYAYYGLPSNFRALKAFQEQVRLLWFRSLRRRSQRRLTWDGYSVLLQRFSLPTPRITHPCEERRA
jgi:RNA-directed DNA polymerase